VGLPYKGLRAGRAQNDMDMRHPKGGPESGILPSGMYPRTTISELHRLGSQEYLVLLACGHSYPVPVADLTRLSLFVGKRVTCRECERTASLRAKT
jgi:hypothetical protein